MLDRCSHALASYKDEFILATGGKILGRITAIAEVYSVSDNRWSLIPDMNVERSDHGSCAVENYVYVACGLSSRYYKYLQGIERINMNAIDDGWEKIDLYYSLLSPRSQIFMAGLSCDELVIIGGHGIEGLRGDAYILNIPQMCLVTVIGDKEERIRFAALRN